MTLIKNIWVIIFILFDNLLDLCIPRFMNYSCFSLLIPYNRNKVQLNMRLGFISPTLFSTDGHWTLLVLVKLLPLYSKHFQIPWPLKMLFLTFFPNTWVFKYLGG